MRTLSAAGYDVRGIDLALGDFTTAVGSIADRDVVRAHVAGTDAVIHAATLHKPHIVTHSRHDFLETNVAATLVLLEEAVAAGVGCFIFTSTTSTFGSANTPPPGAPSAWITEDVIPRPKSIYGATKLCAETLCELFARHHGLRCLVLRTSRFFLEPDDNPELRAGYEDANVKANELLYRRVDIEDVVSAHERALERAPEIGFGTYVISATTPLDPIDLGELRRNAPAVIRRRVPAFEEIYRDRGWRMFPTIDRVYVNTRARNELGWEPRHDFSSVLERLQAGGDVVSELSRSVGIKGYHGDQFADGIYPVG